MIICCGEALIDMLPREIDQDRQAFEPVAGGAIFNTAIGLGRLGENAGLLAGISNDMFGDLLINTLQESNVNTDWCVRSQFGSTLAFVKLTDGQARYSFFDENSANRNLISDDVPALPKELKAMHFGAISLIPEPCGTTYEQLLLKYRENVVVSLDPNIREGFIKDEEAHRSRIRKMISHSDIVKVSDEDLGWIEPSIAPEDAITKMLSDGVSIVVLTQGRKGAAAYTSSTNVHAAARQVEVVDTIGAGDTFNSGFLHALNQRNLLDKTRLAAIENEDLESALQFASDVAAVTVTRAGANPPWKHEL